MERILFNDNWVFEKEGVEEAVKLPHTWNAADGQGSSNYYRGQCKYKKIFSKPDFNGKIYIEFNAANSSSKVLVNGKELLTHDGGYSIFRVDITDYLEDENEIEVYVDNAANDRVYPQRADFTFYGGIYRDVYLLLVDEAHFDLDYYGGSGVYITPSVSDKNVKVIAYYKGEAEAFVSIGEIGEAKLTCVSNDEGITKAEAIVKAEDIHLWDGVNDPYLYTANVTLKQEEQVVDERNIRFGFREYAFDAEEGFLLNGKRYPLHGVSRHQDRLGVGNALSKEMHKEDIELILEMGANSIRLAHYQHEQYVYDLCDELGIICWAEIPYITVHMPNGRDNTISQMKELIVQNFNHTSIICWAMSNEISLEGVTDDLMENHVILNDLIHEMDPSRVSAMANLFMLETDSPLVKLPDIRGYNLYYGWYVGDVEDNDDWFDEFHKEHPDVVIGLTEYGADSTIKLQSPKPEKGDFTEGYQALYHEHILKMLESRPYIWGSYCWNMFEFAAAGRDEAGDPGKNHKGLITFDRKTKKDAFYIYKAYWSNEPFVHLCGRRYADRIENTTEIKVYSNQSEVSLYVDDKLFETKRADKIFTFSVDITGEHTIKAVSGTCVDEMKIKKVNEPNPDYFIDAKAVKNWFDEDEVFEKEGYLSINSTYGEIMANPEGKALLDSMMSKMTENAAGGMGKNVKIPKVMQKLVARQPMKKLLAQGGFDKDGKMAEQLNAALSKIRKV